MDPVLETGYIFEKGWFGYIKAKYVNIIKTHLYKVQLK
jgi:hypothetical protein